MEYLAECERLYRDWVEGRPALSEWSAQFVQPDYAPEPYLRFGVGADEAVFISTNPGKAFDFQRHPSSDPSSIMGRDASYAEAAVRLGSFYAGSRDISIAARANIAAMRRIAAVLGARSVLQIEALPWHSPSLPDKRRVLAEFARREPAYVRYRTALIAHLREHPRVFAWSAGVPGRRGGAGVELKADLIGLDLARAELLPLETKTAVSQAVLWSRDGGRVRGLFVTQGAASLPSAGLNRAGETKDRLLEALRA